MSVERGSSGSTLRLQRAGTVSRSPALGAEPYASRVSNLRVDGDNDDSGFVPVSPLQKLYEVMTSKRS